MTLDLEVKVLTSLASVAESTVARGPSELFLAILPV